MRLLLSLLAVLLLNACRLRPAAPRAVAQVGSGQISEAAYCQALRRQAWATDATARRHLLTGLIERRLWLLAAQQAQLMVRQTAVDRQLRQLRAGYPAAEYRKLLQAQDLTTAELRRQLHDDLLIRKYQREYVQARVALSDAEVEAALARGTAEQAPEQVRLRHLMVTDAQLARQLGERLAVGEPFAELARRHSQSPDAVRGGDLGLLSREQLPVEIAQGCFDLPLRRLSAVLHRAAGHHLCVVLERRPAQRRTAAAQREAIEAQLRQQGMRQAEAAALQQLRQQFGVTVEEGRLEQLL